MRKSRERKSDLGSVLREMREKSRERNKSRERDRSRERERSPVKRHEGTSNTQPSDLHLQGQRLLGEVQASIFNSPVNLEILSQVGETPEQGFNGESHVKESEVPTAGTQGCKALKTHGTFSGEKQVERRVEDWMHDDPLEDPHGHQAKPSYRDILKPKSPEGLTRGQMKVPEEVWDGSLLDDGNPTLLEGVTVTDTTAGPIIEFTENERRRLESKWSQSLIIKLLGTTIGFMQMKKRVQMMWGKTGTVDLNDIGNGYFIASFQQLDDYFFALDGGPWMVANHYLTVQTWKRNFTPWNEKIRTLAVWVRLPGLPGDYYDKKFFYHLGNKIGKAIKVDEMTLMRARTMYARMCVEIDLNAPLLPLYMVDGNKLKIEYEGLYLICFSCGRVGHGTEHCASKAGGQINGGGDLGHTTPEGPTEKAAMPDSPQQEVFGKWMVAQNPKKGRKPMARGGRGSEGQTKAGNIDKDISASRYAVLEQEEVSTYPKRSEKNPQGPLREITNDLEKPRDKKKEGSTRVKQTRNKGKEKEVGTSENKKKGVNNGMGQEEHITEVPLGDATQEGGPHEREYMQIEGDVNRPHGMAQVGVAKEKRQERPGESMGVLGGPTEIQELRTSPSTGPRSEPTPSTLELLDGELRNWACIRMTLRTQEN